MADPNADPRVTTDQATPTGAPGGQHQANVGANKAAERIGGGYLVAAVIVMTVGVVGGLVLARTTDVPDYKLAAGASAFALIYIVAQAIERVNELLVLVLDKASSGFAEAQKQNALKTIKGVHVTSAVPEADAPARLTKARKELRVLTMAVAFGLSFVLLAYLETGLMELVTEGSHPSQPLDWIISAAVFAGGTSALHDLTSKVQKSKEKDEAAA